MHGTAERCSSGLLPCGERTNVASVKKRLDNAQFVANQSRVQLDETRPIARACPLGHCLGFDSQNSGGLFAGKILFGQIGRSGGLRHLRVLQETNQDSPRPISRGHDLLSRRGFVIGPSALCTRLFLFRLLSAAIKGKLHWLAWSLNFLARFAVCIVSDARS